MPEDKILIKKASGEMEAFDVEKLIHSLEKSKAPSNIIEPVVSEIVREIDDGMTTRDIYRRAFELLHKHEKKVAIRYSLRRAIMELGPTGFPFERFVAELFKAQGYEVLTDQIVKGYCVEHEVDVVAWKPSDLVMCEIKFHHELGLKSDLKVVLYVKARFDDLSKPTFDYGSHEQKLSQGWLITNTKFTVSAIKYAECQGMRIVGWNYPFDGNLHDMISKAKLHPITCLNTLNEHDKKALLDQNIVLCTALLKENSVLRNLGLSGANIEAILDEVRLVTAS